MAIVPTWCARLAALRAALFCTFPSVLARHNATSMLAARE